MIPNHCCAAPECVEMIPAYLLVCRDHWSLVPRTLRARVNRAARRLARRPHHGGRAKALLAAREAALAALRQEVAA